MADPSSPEWFTPARRQEAWWTVGAVALEEGRFGWALEAWEKVRYPRG